MLALSQWVTESIFTKNAALNERVVFIGRKLRTFCFPILNWTQCLLTFPQLQTPNLLNIKSASVVAFHWIYKWKFLFSIDKDFPLCQWSFLIRIKIFMYKWSFLFVQIKIFTCTSLNFWKLLFVQIKVQIVLEYSPVNQSWLESANFTVGYSDMDSDNRNTSSSWALRCLIFI
jgi:hypothetical protein